LNAVGRSGKRRREPLYRSQDTEDVYERVRGAILDGELAAGTLMAQVALADERWASAGAGTALGIKWPPIPFGGQGDPLRCR
jgi:hypothetical protein